MHNIYSKMIKFLPIDEKDTNSWITSECQLLSYTREFEVALHSNYIMCSSLTCETAEWEVILAINS